MLIINNFFKGEIMNILSVWWKEIYQKPFRGNNNTYLSNDGIRVRKKRPFPFWTLLSPLFCNKIKNCVDANETRPWIFGYWMIKSVFLQIIDRFSARWGTWWRATGLWTPTTLTVSSVGIVNQGSKERQKNQTSIAQICEVAFSRTI